MLTSEPVMALAGCNDEAVAASVLAYKPALAVKCCTNWS